MHIKEYDEKIREMYERYGRGIINCLRNKKNSYLVDYLNDLFPMLKDEKYKIGMKIYWLINGLDDFPKCALPECQNKITGEECSVVKGYVHKFCSTKCVANSKDILKLKHKTMMEKYNSTSFNNLEMRTKTLRKKYGVDNPSQSIDVIIKIQEKKYGKKLTDEDIQRLKKRLKYYGMSGEDKEFNIFLDEKLPDLKNRKDKYTHAEKLGLRNKYRYFKKMNEKWVDFRPMFDIYRFIDSDPFVDDLEWKCLKCGNVFKGKFNGHYKERLRCLNCNPYNHGHSIIEHEMQDFIQTIVPHDSIDRNTKLIISPLELDDYVRDRDIAFEMDGLYNHSDCCKKDDYHLKKTEMCEENGIKLVHIFEDEWSEKNEQVKDMIRKNLDDSITVIDTGTCELRRIDVKTAKEFVNANSVFNHINTKNNFGLYANGDLVFVCSVLKKNGVLQIERFCEKNGIRIKNGIKTVSEFICKTEHVDEVYVLMNRRFYSVKDIPECFSFVKYVAPNFFYVNYGCDYRMNRKKLNERFLKKELKEYDPEISISENMRKNKYCKIFDCGYIIAKFSCK